MNPSDLFQILSAECGYGKVTTDGTLGFETPLGNRVIHPELDAGTSVISAHAPSRVEIELATAAEAFGFLNATANSGQPVVFLANENPLGVAAGPLQQTETIRLPPGRHMLKTLTPQGDCRHSVWALKPSDATVSSRMAVVTIACYPEREAWQQLWHLSRMLLLHKMSAQVLGVGTEYRTHTDAKVVQVLEFIAGIDAEYILFTDGKDSLVIADEEEIVSEFKRFDTDFVISMERGCWPIFEDEWRKAFPPVKDDRNWPNAGGWMGTKAGVLRVLRECKKLGTDLSTGNATGLAKRWESVLRGKIHDDQALMQILYLNGEIIGDKDCRTFTNLGTASWKFENGDYDISGNRMVVRATGARPQVIHFSGGACGGARDQWAAILGV